MQIYKKEDILKINSEYVTVKNRYIDLMIQLFVLSPKLKEEKAKEYLHQGVSRRWEVIERCIENIFSIFPAERNNLLSHEELIEIEINLHAFFVNIFGLLDNLAWVFIHEQKLTGAIDKIKVGLFKKETKKYLPLKFCNYLDSPQIKLWHKQYLINYRDALSHRIPLYVPPQILNPEQKNQMMQMDQEIISCYKTRDFTNIEKLRKQQLNIGTVCPFFVHDSSESKGVFLHAQLIADFNTIEDILKNFCETFFT
jgi:hypothetical protein